MKIQKMKKLLTTLVATGLWGINAIAGNAEARKPIEKPCLVATRVQNEEAEPINRIEIVGKLPYNFE